MTKFVFWVGVILMLVAYLSYRGKYTNECLESGGKPILTIDKAVCIHPSAVIELEMENKK